MTASIITTPFGRGRYNLSRFATQLAARAAIFGEASSLTGSTVSVGDRSNQPAAVHKWRLLRALTEARHRLGLGERTLTVLSALLSFHPETVLSLPGAVGNDPGKDEGEGRATGLGLSLIVFPSNRELSLRAQGLCERSLARHLGALADSGLIIRRDSPNGKRYARKGQDGVIETAFGFDLTPLVLRAAEFEDAADAARREAAELRALRERCTLARRAAAGFLMLAETEALVGPWQDYATLLAGFALPRRRASADELCDLAKALEELAIEIGCSVQQATCSEHEDQQESGSARRSDSHHPYSKIDSHESEPASEEEGQGPSTLADEAEKAATRPSFSGQDKGGPPMLSKAMVPLSLGFVRQACPSLNTWTGEPARDWPAFVRSAHVARAALGISLDGWLEAVEAMGEQVAAVTVAAILERVEQAQSSAGQGGASLIGQGDVSGAGARKGKGSTSAGEPPVLIRSPGGYLRSLSAKARVGTFRPEPFLMALIATRGRG
jgi:replication initiation protein RepC